MRIFSLTFFLVLAWLSAVSGCAYGMGNDHQSRSRDVKADTALTQKKPLPDAETSGQKREQAQEGFLQESSGRR